MKILLLIVFVNVVFYSISQSPLGINYQAVLRNSTGGFVANTTVGYKLEIRKTSSTGQVVYSERHTPLSNSQALVNIIIGGGTVIQGSFSTISWGSGPYFLVSSIDFTGGTNYQNFGSQQLMSVPYALYANTAGAAINKWLYGTTSPLATLGTAGDYYLNTTNGSVSYNNNGTWGVIGNLTGPQGQVGVTGTQGPSGPTGLTGATGNGISSVVDNGNGTLTFYFTNGTTFTTSNLTGPTGATGSAGATGSQGPIGLTGPQGIAGTNGSNGVNGTNGQNSLVKTSVEANGANCSTGGMKLEYGLDANSNGILDLSEINASLTKYVCNGATGVAGSQGATGPAGVTGSQGPIGSQGPQGASGTNGTNGSNGTNGQNSLVKTTIESIGVNCTTGGMKLEYGLDANANGILDLSEINASLTKYVCNGSAGATGPQGTTGPTGATGPQGQIGLTGPQGTAGTNGSNGINGSNGQNSLVKTSVEAIGVNCSNGGMKIEYGLDANTNGILDLSEINASLTKYVCNGAIGSTGPQGPAGSLPSGTINQTLHHNGTTWVANSLITNTGANVGIGTTNPNSSALLTVNSTSQGILLPSMTQAQRNLISAPATGLLVFQTDNTPGFYYFNGTTWVGIGGTSSTNSSGSNPNTLIYTSDGF